MRYNRLVRPSVRPTMAGGISWDGTSASRGLLLAVPAAVGALVDVRAGAVLAIGVLPAALLPLPPSREHRRRYLVVGLLTAVSFQTGALLAERWWLAVPGLAVLGWLGGVLAARAPAGMVALTLCLPMVAIGFSYPGWEPAIWLSLLLVAGSAYAWLVSLAWPSTREQGTTGPRRPPGLVAYGVTAGLVGATCAAIGFGLDLEHVGWVAGAALLVMRPSWELQRRRSIGRVVAVAVGAVAAIASAAAHPPSVVSALLVTAAVVGATATGASRWYVTPAFTTFLVFTLLLSEGDGAADRFWERLSETALGVVVALLGVLAAHGAAKARPR